MEKRLLQQGDVLFFQMDELPKDLTPVKVKDPRGVVFAEGEVTGHCHATLLDEFIEVFQDPNNEMWVNITGEKPKVVTHQEHGDIALDPGVYKIGIVQEVDPFSEEIRKVAD